LRPTLADRPRDDAACARRRELCAALRAQCIDPARVLMDDLGLADQEAAFSMAATARRLARVIVTLGSDVVITHPYEGGHPDHDAVAFAAHAAVELARARGHAVALGEMTSYHRAHDRFVSGAFRDDNGPRPPCDRVRATHLDPSARA